ncbi:hypothetical protein IU459_16210 [Nocardia amamiensis]|uniref:Uncharacterized protein n=1 Tax=Nocardia amamiensis TaxID=404578 RepID=A0ABS0CR31_9NOCA|nr:hypothetical protein [Nocardia amamiensis]MBF6299074.1 hypothetical protein [Nocardia amamiensis]
MPINPFEKKPAFFPFVSAEVFFEAEDAELNLENPAGIDEALDAELDVLLATS